VGLDALRAHVARAVTDATGRELLIEGPLKPVWSWAQPRVRAEKVRFANPGWAKEPHMFRADAVEASVSVLPLLRGRLVIPELRLERAELNLKRDADGRNNWLLDRQHEQTTASRILIRSLTLDEGTLTYHDALRDAGVRARVSADASGTVFDAVGNYRGRKLNASGKGGRVVSLEDASSPFPLKARAQIGSTTLQVEGFVSGLARLERIDSAMQLSGQTMHDLYGIMGLAFPGTRPYSASGRVTRERNVVRWSSWTPPATCSTASSTCGRKACSWRSCFRRSIEAGNWRASSRGWSSSPAPATRSAPCCAVRTARSAR
jgi:uncharacterized protein involved in outer membrane biogenesis